MRQSSRYLEPPSLVSRRSRGRQFVLAPGVALPGPRSQHHHDPSITPSRQNTSNSIIVSQPRTWGSYSMCFVYRGSWLTKLCNYLTTSAICQLRPCVLGHCNNLAWDFQKYALCRFYQYSKWSSYLGTCSFRPCRASSFHWICSSNTNTLLSYNSKSKNKMPRKIIFQGFISCRCFKMPNGCWTRRWISLLLARTLQLRDSGGRHGVC